MLKRRRDRLQTQEKNPALEEIKCDLGRLRRSLKCESCSKVLSNALTITECLHSFCAPCINEEVRDNGTTNKCPKCEILLGVMPFSDKKIIVDGRKNGLVQIFKKQLEALIDEDEDDEKDDDDVEVVVAGAAAAAKEEVIEEDNNTNTNDNNNNNNNNNKEEKEEVKADDLMDM